MGTLPAEDGRLLRAVEVVEALDRDFPEWGRVFARTLEQKLRDDEEASALGAVEATVAEYVEAEDKAWAEGQQFKVHVVDGFKGVRTFTGADGRLRIIRGQHSDEYGELRRAKAQAG